MGVLLCGLVALLLGSAPQTARTLPTAIQDDAVLLHGSDASVRQAITQIASLGTKYVRLTAGWSVLSPSPTSPTPPKAPFDPTNSATYAKAPFHALDRAVIDAHQSGMQVMIDVAFWAPRWAVPVRSPDGRNRYKPNPILFGDFAQAVARRYNGHTQNPADPHQLLPAVTTYTIWNEPNHAQFLQPQWVHTPTGWVAESAQIYRAMYVNAYAAIKSVAAGDQVLIGATSSNGSATPGRGDVTPLDFLRALTCVDRRLRALRIPACAGYTPLQADGYAHHPYSLDNPPDTSSTNAGNVPLADLPRLENLLGALRFEGRITTDWPLYVTEYGYETDPPDPFTPFSPEDQAAFIGWSTFIVWRDPDTRMFAQFLLRDSAPDPGPVGSRKAWQSYQTGLYYADGEAKPAVEAFRLPFWVQRIGTGSTGPLVAIFGETRAATSGRQLVAVQQLSTDGMHWLAVHTLTPGCDPQGQFLTDSSGFFLTAAAFAGSPVFRLAWRRPDGVWEYGVPVSVADSNPIDAGPGVGQPGSVLSPATQPFGRYAG